MQRNQKSQLILYREPRINKNCKQIRSCGLIEILIVASKLPAKRVHGISVAEFRGI